MDVGASERTSPFAKTNENLLTAALLTMLVGLVVAWRWECVGGLLILGGLAFFAIVNHGVQAQFGLRADAGRGADLPGSGGGGVQKSTGFSTVHEPL